MGLNHTKRYMVIFNIWTDKKFKETKTEYDNIKDVKEETNLIDEVYRDTPVPLKVLKEKSWKKEYDTYTISYEDGRKYWGYCVVDFEKQEILKYGGHGLINYGKKTDQRIVKDVFFRGNDEIPKGYQWDDGEYEGWLQYRWGNGKNAIGYKEPEPKKTNNLKKEKVNNNVNEETENDDIQQKYDVMFDKENVKRLKDRW